MVQSVNRLTDLSIHKFEPRSRLSAVSTEPASDPLFPIPPPLVLFFFLSKINIQKKIFFNFLMFLFIYFESVSRGGAEREGEREDPKQAPRCLCRA